jgi:hypothetical protein
VVPSRVNPALPCVVTPYQVLTERLDEVRAALPAGQVAFIGAYSEKPRIGAGPVVWFREIVVGPGPDQFTIPVLAGTRTNTGCDLLPILRNFHERYGLDIRSAERDSVGFQLQRLPDDLPAFVDELYRISPDPVDIGWTQAPYIWVEQIAADRHVWLWWQGV